MPSKCWCHALPDLQNHEPNSLINYHVSGILLEQQKLTKTKCHFLYPSLGMIHVDLDGAYKNILSSGFKPQGCWGEEQYKEQYQILPKNAWLETLPSTTNSWFSEGACLISRSLIPPLALCSGDPNYNNGCKTYNHGKRTGRVSTWEWWRHF